MTDLFDPAPRAPAGLLAPPFDCFSPASPPPHTIPQDARLAEIRRELDERRHAYPRRVQAGRMTRDQADAELAAMAAIAADLAGQHQPGYRPDPAVRWKAKLACLRREITLRRNHYPAWVASGRLALGAATAQIAALEAVHAEYWIGLWWWDGAPVRWNPAAPDYAATAPARDQIRHHAAALDALAQQKAAA